MNRKIIALHGQAACILYPVSCWLFRTFVGCMFHCPRALFVVSSAFAPALLEAAGEESGGFHFRDESSSGKTTLLLLAASVWGGTDYLQRWRATTNGLEGLAQMCCQLMLLGKLNEWPHASRLWGSRAS
jgi:hypothetical protein